MSIKDIKFYIGPMSKNIVDSILEVSEEHKIFGLIPSRRQIDFNTGYVNNWTTKTFSNYVDGKVIVERDHGGPKQGEKDDYGFASFETDTRHLDIIHIDPWKLDGDFTTITRDTVAFIKHIYSLNTEVYFEVGTEEAIRPFSTNEFEIFLQTIKEMLTSNIFSQIKYAVIQSGVGLDVVNKKNIGLTSLSKLEDMVAVCNKFNIMSKEHNGDYLSALEMETRFNKGLSAINIAPEFGQIETQCYLDNMNSSQIDQFYDICYKSNRWKKWVSKHFDVKDKHKLITVCGHYVLSNPLFLKMKPSIDYEIKTRIKDKLYQFVNIVGVSNART